MICTTSEINPRKLKCYRYLKSSNKNDMKFKHVHKKAHLIVVRETSSSETKTRNFHTYTPPPQVLTPSHNIYLHIYCYIVFGE